jgi:hypothetical protein
MQNKYYTIALIFAILIAASSCSSKIISTNYYTLHQKELMHIETIYKYLYQQKPFSIAFTSKNLQIVSVEMKTDSLNYIYEFNTIDATALNIHKYQTQSYTQAFFPIKILHAGLF